MAFRSIMLMIAAICLTAVSVSGQTASDLPAPAGAPLGAVPIPLYGTANPGSLDDEIPTGTASDVRNVTYPTLTRVLPAPGTANGAAVIVAPGGGFMFLSMESEGWRVADALAARGITVFVLKYRLSPTPKNKLAYMAHVARLVLGISGIGSGVDLDHAPAVEDMRTALDLVRSRWDDWDIDPSRIGVMGFSAGAIATRDAITAGARPDFAGYVYGPMEAIDVPKDAPPLFVALAMDDGLFGRSDFGLVTAWRDARRAVELHVYQRGGHGFGVGKPGETNALIMPQFLAWLEMQGFMKGG